MHDKHVVAAELSAIWTSVVGAPPPLDDPAARTGSLWNLGLTSAGFVRLLTAIEDAFALVWDLDDSVDAVSSFDRLLDHVAEHAGRLPGAAAGAASGRP
ncbi:hypothetical protein [Streptomyces sp. URMC 123]|uniref:hypothetical protein n=1 Tax=Streptomyces sp. URMC 123 TaxID=3423403 RepID=UPI003F1A0843